LIDSPGPARQPRFVQGCWPRLLAAVQCSAHIAV
jgi:hypothetical protein